MLLGDLYADTNEPHLAARQLILARAYEEAQSVARGLGDLYLDVSDLIASPVSWVAATAFEFVAEEADLVPDASVDSLIEAALSAIDDVKTGNRADSPVYSPQITRSAYKMIGELSERMSHDHAVAVLESLSGHVTAQANHYWPTDESHIRVASGIATTRDDEVASVALDHLVGLYARRAHPFGNKAEDALKKNLPAVQLQLQELAEGGHYEARALLATGGEQHIDPEQALAAADRLEKPTSNSLGHYAEGGTRAIKDSLLARALSPAQRSACIEMLLQNARSPYEGSGNRETYFLAAANLSEGLDEEQHRKFLADIVDFIGNPPPSQPDILNGSMASPLGMMQWSGLRQPSRSSTRSGFLRTRY